MGRNLTNKAIQDTYEGLVQISGSLLTDGTGSLIDNLDVSASFATTATSASHAVNSDTATSASFATSASYAVSSSADDLTLQDITDNGNSTTNNINLNGRAFSNASISTPSAGQTFTILGGTTDSTLVLQGNDALATNSIKLNPSTGIQLSGSVASQNDITAPTFIGDLTGNADTATSASHAVNSDTAISASYAQTASLALALEGGVPLQSVLDAGNEAQADMVLTGSLKLGDGGTHYNAINIETFDGTNTITGDGNSVGSITIGQGNTTGKGTSISIGRNNNNATFGNGQDNVIFGYGNDISSGNFTSHNYIFGRNLSITGDGNYRTLVGGNNNDSPSGALSGIFAGEDNTNGGNKSVILGGDGATISNGILRSAIIGGENNTINGGQGGAVVGGINNVVSHNRSVVIGGNGLSTTKDDEVVVDSLVANSITASFASFQSASIGYLQSITGSAKIIGDAYIILNNDTPTERYAGLVVQDSGSTQNTASLEFDGQTNDWFYEYTDDGGATTEHGVALFGAEYSTKGSPVYPADNVLQKGNGGHHLQDSNITDDGSLITLDSKTKIVGADLEDDILVVQGQDSGGGAIIITEFDSDAGSGMGNTFRFIDSSTNGALLRMDASRGIAKIDANGTGLDVQADGDITLEAVGGNITLDANAGAGQTDISGSTNVVLPTTGDRFKVINDNEKLGVVIRGGIMAGSDETLSTDTGFNNALFGERITADGNGIQTCGALAGREVDFGQNQIEYSAFIATYNGTMDGANKSAIVGGASNNIDTEDSLGQESVIAAGNNNRIGAGNQSFIGGGSNNSIVEGNNRAIIAGSGNSLLHDSGVAEYSGSVIVGGFNNLSKYNNTIILGGLSITASAHDTTYTENLDVNGTLSIPGFPDVSASLASSGGGGATEWEAGTAASSSVSVLNNNPADIASGSPNSLLYSSGSTITATNGWNVLLGGQDASLGGGGYGAVIIGGLSNEITDNFLGSIIGGRRNDMRSYAGIIAGASDCIVDGGFHGFAIGTQDSEVVGNIDNAGILGGDTNIVSHNRSVIVGGQNLSTTKADEVVVPYLTTDGGVNTGASAAIGANQLEVASTNITFNANAQQAFVAGTETSTIGSGVNQGAIIGSSNSSIEGTRNVVIGGYDNDIASVNNASIFGGVFNDITGGTYPTIVGGETNTISGGENAVLVGGEGNTASHNRSAVIGGSSLSTTKADEVVVPNLLVKGNVVQDINTITITSNTGSLDASLGSLYQITLQNGVDTLLEIENQVAGQTLQLKIINNATSAGTISFDSQFEFEGGTAFTATATTNAVDILTLTTFDGTSVQAVGAKNFS